VYRCAGDDGWVALTIRTDAEWERLVEVVGADRLGTSSWRTLTGRVAEQDVIDAAITVWTSARTKHEAAATLQAAGLASAAVLTNADIVEDPHLTARGFMVEVDQVDVGKRLFPGIPVHVAAEPALAVRGTPPLGGDNAAILCNLLGRSFESAAELERERVLFSQPP
jgi:crotonobetainyl-CoA:carnitine CoA-transferase CaiB-like acyl-CoA transferase